MWRHFVNLLSKSWQNLLVALSSSTLAVVVSFAIPTLVFIFVLAYNLRQAQRAGRKITDVLRSTVVPTAITGGITILVWLCLFSWSIAKTIYDDHVFLATRGNVLADGNKTLRDENSQLKSTPPKTITHTLPAPEPAKTCRASTHFGLPDSKVQGAVTATAVIIRCNYKIDAPFVVAVEFDRDFIPGSVDLPDDGKMEFNPAIKQGRVFLAIVTVYGRTDQFPRPVKAGLMTVE